MFATSVGERAFDALLPDVSRESLARGAEREADLARLEAAPRYVAAHVENMRAGLARGMTLPRAIESVRGVVGALATFRRFTEWLGREMGVYEGPYEEFGCLVYEMWRACRLVDDTGLHALDWDRARAIDYLATHTALALHDCTSEVDRYIAWPGQALAYKAGELELRRLRADAEARLGPHFDVRAFHDLVLGAGTVTLDVLGARVERWLRASD